MHQLVLQPATSFSSQIQHHQGLGQVRRPVPLKAWLTTPFRGQNLQARELAFGWILLMTRPPWIELPWRTGGWTLLHYSHSNHGCRTTCPGQPTWPGLAWPGPDAALLGVLSMVAIEACVGTKRLPPHLTTLLQPPACVVGIGTGSNGRWTPPPPAAAAALY